MQNGVKKDPSSLRTSHVNGPSLGPVPLLLVDAADHVVVLRVALLPLLLLGVNSIVFYMNFGHKTGYETGPSAGPNSVLGHYKFKYVSKLRT